ncbi:hypothetical protein ID866_7366 [Astraeus odoratus]|nr:hypothetical protein ID866_7366 [Astraeus odoratus]
MTNIPSPSLIPAPTNSTFISAVPTVPTIPLADRNDIHKSCRTIEVLVSALTDYCEAAHVLASVQKKLSRALKDAAGIKGGAEPIVNALSAAASIFEVLADVDAKFAKIAGKECGGMSAEVKKWLKKLAKEERAHDERMNESNAKIKQASQSYEKKSKKGARDAGEEHARYINLLSVVGPEMSQEKHNHTVFVAQQHALTMFGVAACLARVADAEWARTCESVRRFAPTIGPLGQWRALCEGAWSGPLPEDLPEPPDMAGIHCVPLHTQFSTSFHVSPTPTATTAVDSTAYGTAVSEWGLTGVSTPTSQQRSLPMPPGGGGVFPHGSTPLEPPRLPYASNTHTSTSTHTSASTNDSINSRDGKQGSINSITTLSAFPLPPAHIPIPAPVSASPIGHVDAERQRQHAQQAQQTQHMQIQNIEETLSQMEIRNYTQAQVQSGHTQPVFESPKTTESVMRTDAIPGTPDPSKSPHIPSPALQRPAISRQNSDNHLEERSRPESSLGHRTSASSNIATTGVTGAEPPRPRRRSIIARPPLPSPAPKSPLPPPPVPVAPSPTLPFRPESPFKRAERIEQAEEEFGVQDGGAGPGSGNLDGSSRSAFKNQSIDAGKKLLERNESTGSTVAALRNRYSRVIEAPAQGPKDIPRLPMSVSEIASRYQPADEPPMSPRRMAASPSTDRFPPFSETPMRQATRDIPIDENEIRRRKQRVEELAELELKEKEIELRQRERELNQRSRELERDRLQFLNTRPDFSGGILAEPGPRGPRNSPFIHKRGSQSVSHIVLPHPSSSSSISSNTAVNASASTSQLPLSMPVPLPNVPNRISHSPSRSQTSTPLPAKDHAPFCGCDSCSISKYRLPNPSPTARDLRPPEPPIILRAPDKPKGWIRRLSMPSVSGAFSLDAAKKNAVSLASLKQGLPIPVGETGRLRKRSFEQGLVGRGVAGVSGQR